MADERIVIEIDAETGAVLKQFKRTEQAAKKTGKKAGKSFNDGFRKGTSRAIDGIKGRLLALGGVVATVFGARFAVQAAAEFEAIQTRLETLTGSAKAASQVFEDLKQFSAETPFQLGDIANASSKLISFGFSAATVKDRIKEIGEVAAGSGADIQELSLIYGQVAAAGKLTGERLLQLQERAIPIGPALAKSLGIAESSVRDFISAGKVSFATFEKAFRSLQQEGGLFAGSLEKQSKTINGILSTLGDNAKIFGAELGNAFKPAIIDSANALIKIFQRFGDQFSANGPVISRTLASIADTLLITPAKFWLNFFAGDAASNLAKINGEISQTQRVIDQLNKDFDRQNKSAFSRFIGADVETLVLIGESKNKLKELIQVRNELIKQDKTIASVRSDEARKFGGLDPEQIRLQAEAEKKANALRAAERQKAQDQSLQALGDVGLRREQIIRQNTEKELAAIQLAEETKAITQQQAEERRLVVVQNSEQQLTAIKQQEAQKREQARQQELQKELESEKTLSDILGNVSKRFESVRKQFRITSKDIANSLVSGFGNAAGSAFASFGKALATGQDALAAFGDALLQAFGGALVQLGTGFILQGIAQSIAGFGSGAPLIAAGAALATFGGVLQGLGGGGGGVSTAVGSGGGGVAVGGDGGFGESTVTEPVEERQEPETSVNVVIQGDVLDSDSSGLRIVELINNAFEKDGVVVKGASFA